MTSIDELVHFGAFKDHIGFCPTARGVAAFADELGDFKVTKGTIHLPHAQPLPLDPVRRIVEFRAAENRLKKAKKPPR